LKAKTRETLVAWGMVIPALLVISIIAFLPLFQTFYNSFFETGLRPDIEKKFVGLEIMLNYSKTIVSKMH